MNTISEIEAAYHEYIRKCRIVPDVVLLPHSAKEGLKRDILANDMASACPTFDKISKILGMDVIFHEGEGLFFSASIK